MHVPHARTDAYRVFGRCTTSTSSLWARPLSSAPRPRRAPAPHTHKERNELLLFCLAGLFLEAQRCDDFSGLGARWRGVAGGRGHRAGHSRTRTPSAQAVAQETERILALRSRPGGLPQRVPGLCRTRVAGPILLMTPAALLLGVIWSRGGTRSRPQYYTRYCRTLLQVGGLACLACYRGVGTSLLAWGARKPGERDQQHTRARTGSS